MPTDREFIPWASASRELTTSGAYSQPLGGLTLDWSGSWVDGRAVDLDGEPHVAGADGTARIDLSKSFGTVSLSIPDGVVVDLDLTTDSISGAWLNTINESGEYGPDSQTLADSEGRIRQTIGSGPGVDVVITGSIGGSTLQVQQYVSDLAEDPTQTEEVQP